MTTESIRNVVGECYDIPKDDRTPEQQTIIELYETIVTSYENVTGEKWVDNLPCGCEKNQHGETLYCERHYESIFDEPIEGTVIG